MVGYRKIKQELSINLKPLRKDKSNLIVLEACLVTDSTQSWIDDSEVTNYVYCSLQWYKETKRLEEGEFSFILRNIVRYQ